MENSREMREKRQKIRKKRAQAHPENRDLSLPWNTDSAQMIRRKSEPHADTSGCQLPSLPAACASFQNLKHENPAHATREAASALPRSRVSGGTTVAMAAVYWRLEGLQELQHHTQAERERGGGLGGADPPHNVSSPEHMKTALGGISYLNSGTRGGKLDAGLGASNTREVKRRSPQNKDEH